MDVAEADALLDDAGLGWAYLVDNGRAGGWPRRSVHAYHLLPRGVGKALAVADDLALRGLDPEAAVAVGDSHADATMAAVVGTYVQVANGLAPVGHGNRFGVKGAAMGDGFSEVVNAILAASARKGGELRPALSDRDGNCTVEAYACQPSMRGGELPCRWTIATTTTSG